ncbi:MAG: hypothetical protein GY710_08880 [Desulfobacteraceae bacterium]|nr:hypothetical protein [Desulfobacteraceae bacterium]
MTKDIPFDFLDVIDAYVGGRNTYFCKISECVKGKGELLEDLSEKLKFPSYFGKNWDALTDLLLDLSWFEESTIVLAHEILPLNDDLANLKIYLDILKQVMFDWMEEDSPKLKVVFSLGLKQKVLKLLSE